MPAQAWLAVGRWASYLGIGVLIGAVWVLGAIWSAGLRTRRATVLLAVAGAVGLAGTMIMIAAQADENVGSATAWGEVIDTQSGRWWLVRLILLAVAFVVVMLRRLLRRTPLWLYVAWLGGLGLLAVVAAGGHAITGRWAVLGLVATVTHLAAMALWAGGLAALAFAVPRGRIMRSATAFSPDRARLGRRPGLHRHAQRLAPVGLVGRPDPQPLRHLADRQAGAHRRRPRAGDGQPLAGPAAGREPARRRAVRRTVIAEVLGILVVMVATTGLVSSPPPHNLTVSSASVNIVQGTRIAQIILSPPVSGGTTMHVTITSTDGSLAAPTSIAVSATLPSQQLGPLDIPAEPAGPGHVIATNAVLPLAGTWTFTVTARFSEFDQTVFTAPLVVR